MSHQRQRRPPTARLRPVKSQVPSELPRGPVSKQRLPGAASSLPTPDCGRVPCLRLPRSPLAPLPPHPAPWPAPGGRQRRPGGGATDGKKLSTCGAMRGLLAGPDPRAAFLMWPRGSRDPRLPPAPLGGISAARRWGHKIHLPRLQAGLVSFASRGCSALFNLCASVNLLAPSFVFTGFKAFQAPLEEDGAERLPHGVRHAPGAGAWQVVRPAF